MIVNVNTSVRILEKISLTIIVGIAAYLAYLAAYIVVIVFGGLFTIIHVGAYDLMLENDIYLKLAGIFMAFVLFHVDNILAHYTIECIKNIKYNFIT